MSKSSRRRGFLLLPLWSLLGVRSSYLVPRIGRGVPVRNRAGLDLAPRLASPQARKCGHKSRPTGAIITSKQIFRARTHVFAARPVFCQDHCFVADQTDWGWDRCFEQTSPLWHEPTSFVAESRIRWNQVWLKQFGANESSCKMPISSLQHNCSIGNEENSCRLASAPASRANRPLCTNLDLLSQSDCFLQDDLREWLGFVKDEGNMSEQTVLHGGPYIFLDRQTRSCRGVLVPSILTW